MTGSARDRAIEDIAARIFRESHVSSRPGQCESLEEIARDLRDLAGAESVAPGVAAEPTGPMRRLVEWLAVLDTPDMEHQRRRASLTDLIEKAQDALAGRSPAVESPTKQESEPAPSADDDPDGEKGRAYFHGLMDRFGRCTCPSVDDELGPFGNCTERRLDGCALCRHLDVDWPCPTTKHHGYPQPDVPVAEPPAPAAEPPPSSSCCNGTGLADYAAVPCPNPSCPVPAPAAVGTTPQTERASLIPEIERALFGTEDGELVHDDSDLPVGELRRLLREEWAGAAPGDTAAECEEDVTEQWCVFSDDPEDGVVLISDDLAEVEEMAPLVLAAGIAYRTVRTGPWVRRACCSGCGSVLFGGDDCCDGRRAEVEAGQAVLAEAAAGRESIEDRAKRDPAFASELRAAQTYHEGLRDGFVRGSAETEQQ